MHTLCARGTMKPEINAAVGFLTRFLRVKGHVNDRQVQTFSQSLHDILAGKKKKRILRTELHPARCQISLYTEFGWLWVTYWLNLGCLCGERSLRRSFFVLSKYHYQRSPARTLFAHVWGGGWKKKNRQSVITQAKYSTFSQSKSQPRMDLITKTQFGDTLIG